MNAACKICSWSVVVLASLGVAGCARGVREAAPSQPLASQPRVSHEGPPHEVVSAESLLTIRVYRGGTLARAGHNHLVASHDLAGTAYLPSDLTHASFELRIPVDKLTVDEAPLRAQEGPDFSADVPDSAREGTRRNMLGPALLDGEHFPEILLRSGQVNVTAPNELQVHVQVTVRDRTTEVVAPVHLETTAEGLVATGGFPLRHADLGLAPFSVMMGAMQVQDEMQIRFRIHCVARPQA